MQLALCHVKVQRQPHMMPALASHLGKLRHRSVSTSHGLPPLLFKEIFLPLDRKRRLQPLHPLFTPGGTYGTEAKKPHHTIQGWQVAWLSKGAGAWVAGDDTRKEVLSGSETGADRGAAGMARGTTSQS